MIRFLIVVIFSYLFGIYSLQAQNITIKNKENHKKINDDTLYIQSVDNGGWVGAESLNLSIIVKNTGLKTIEIGARKIELDTLQGDVQHTICFGGQCYDTSTFESPFHVTLKSGQSDSGFIAHYLFDNRTHKRGTNRIAYVFYDVNQPNDSVFVHVVYNTVIATSLKLYSNIQPVYITPNPASNYITIESSDESKKIFYIYNVLGSEMTHGFLQKNISLNLENYPSGLYYIRIDNQLYRFLKN